MPKKVILFLSDYKGNAQEQVYLCPDGSTVNGTQTNEAPVKYLLQAYPDISEILCIVTPEARASALAPFTEMVRAAAPKVKVADIPFAEDQDFSGSAMKEIMRFVSAKKKDSILLETTGGFRNAIMYLLLVSRVLSYSGIRTAGAVYSNFKTGQVEDISHLIGLFDLVGGMQELASFGSVGTLREYYARQDQTEPEISALLSAMERLKEDISLCRAGKLDQRIESFNAAIEQAEHCSDTLMCALLPAFRAKFGKRLTIPGLIKWCVNSDMLQQALTLYKEQIPAYILGQRPDILSVKPDAPAPETKRDYATVEEARFFEHLLKMGRNLGSRSYDTHWTPDGTDKDYTVTTLERLEEVLPYSYFTSPCPAATLREILMDYLYIRMLRNMVNHANDQEIPSQQQLMDYLSDYHYKRLNDVRAEDIRLTLERGLERLRLGKGKEHKR